MDDILKGLLKAHSDEPHKLLEQVTNILIEHFDAVQIVATRVTPEGTQAFECGAGCWYSRTGAIDEWLDMKRNYANRMAQRDADLDRGVFNEHDDDDDNWKTR